MKTSWFSLAVRYDREQYLDGEEFDRRIIEERWSRQCLRLPQPYGDRPAPNASGLPLTNSPN
jgi:hypothetical protein